MTLNLFLNIYTKIANIAEQNSSVFVGFLWNKIPNYLWKIDLFMDDLFFRK